MIRARINDCHRRLNYYNDKIQQRLDKLKRLLPTTLLSTIQTIADKRADKTAEQHRAKAKQKLTRLQDTKNAKRRKPDANWVRNISSRPLDETETQVLAYGLKHSVPPKQIPTEAIVSSVEAVLSRQHELSESTKVKAVPLLGGASTIKAIMGSTGPLASCSGSVIFSSMY